METIFGKRSAGKQRALFRKECFSENLVCVAAREEFPIWSTVPFKKGKVYTVDHGILTAEGGREFGPFKDLFALNSSLKSQFIKFVEE